MKSRFKTAAILIVTILAVGLPAMASAQFSQGLTNAITWGRGSGMVSSLNFFQFISNIGSFFVNIISVLATLGIIIGGTMYIVSVGNEQRASQAKRIISSSLIGLFIVLARYVLTNIIYTWLEVTTTQDAITPVTIINNIINFITALIAITATLMIIIGGFQYLTSVGDDQKTNKAKQTIFAAVAGLFIALIAHLLTEVVKGITSVGGANAWPLLSRVLLMITYALSFTATVAVAAFIYGGFTYLTSGGSEDKIQRGKKIIIYAVVGISVIMLSAAIVNIIIGL